MKRRVIFLVTGILLILFLTIPAAQGATTLKRGATPVIPKGKVIHDDLYIMGDNVIIEGTILGDTAAMGGTVTLDGVTEGNAMVAGGTVTINGDVKNDLFVGGGTVIIKGKIYDDLRVMGGNVLIDGEVKGDVIAAGGSIMLSAGSKVGRDMFAAGGNVRIAGKVKRSLRISSGSALISGVIGRNVRIRSEKIEILPTAQITGNLNYISREKAEIEKDALIKGRITHRLPPEKVKKKAPAASAVFSVFSYPIRHFLSLVAMLIVGGILVLLFPKTMSLPIQAASSDIWKYLGIGLLLLFAIPIISTILLFTLIGTPLGLIILAIYAVLIYISRIVVGIYIGSKLLQVIKKDFASSAGWSLVFGLIILAIISLAEAIPFVGWFLIGLFNLAVAAIGLGGIGVTIKNLYPKVQEVVSKSG